ncbi:MAG TPA: Fur family transcriptional regulator [Spirochaetota bacterium]|nr:Fur family transcriptional regulator [Spirochaetota bacterium]
MNSRDYLADLSGKGIQPSVQRVKIYEFLWNNRIHPTADDIYERLHPEIPTLSRTTVYNTMKLFLENGLVQPIVIEEKEIRYDIDVSAHGHFKCDRCGKVFDFRSGISEEGVFPELAGFQIRERHLYFKGLCKSCAKH